MAPTRTHGCPCDCGPAHSQVYRTAFLALLCVNAVVLLVHSRGPDTALAACPVASPAAASSAAPPAAVAPDDGFAPSAAVAAHAGLPRHCIAPPGAFSALDGSSLALELQPQTGGGGVVYADFESWRGPDHHCPRASDLVPPPTLPVYGGVALDACATSPAPPRVSLLVQSFRSPKSLRASFATWRATFLLPAYVSDVVVYFNERNTTRDDAVVHAALAGSGIPFVILGDDRNVQLGAALLDMTAAAASEVVVFLEKDWRANERAAGRVVRALAAAHAAVAHSGVDVVQLRKERPLSGAGVWPCGSPQQLLACSTSRQAEWSNNPFVASRTWLRRVFGFWGRQTDSALYGCHHEFHVRRYIDIEELFHRRIIPWATASWVVAQALPGDGGNVVFEHFDVDACHTADCRGGTPGF